MSDPTVQTPTVPTSAANSPVPPATPAPLTGAAGGAAPIAGAPIIQEIPLKSIDIRLQKQVDVADKAVDKNPTYTIEICGNILNSQPGCLEIRKIMRKAQKKAAIGKNKGMTKFLALTKTPFAFRASAQVKSNPKGSLDEAEKLITQNPSNVQAHQLLGAAATALGMMQTAVFAYECVRELEPDNLKNLLALAGAMMDAGQNKEAIKVCDHILDLSPGNGDAQALVRKASVSISMDKGKWEEQGGDFRSKLADADTATKLEQANRTVNDADTTASLIADLTVKIEKEPENMTNYRDIIGHYKNLQKFDDALVWVRKARQMPQGKADVTFEKWETDFMTANMKTKIAELETALAAGPDPAKQAALDELRKQDLEFRLLQSKTLVDKYPNDYGYRYDYGTLLYETGQVDAAIRELQFSRRNPKVAQQAMLQLGRAYRKKGILDLAEEQLESAKRDITAMNDLKKEVIYELASVYQENKKADKAIDEFKAIYANDIDYRDVAKIINDYYEKKSRG